MAVTSNMNDQKGVLVISIWSLKAFTLSTKIDHFRKIYHFNWNTLAYQVKASHFCGGVYCGSPSERWRPEISFISNHFQLTIQKNYTVLFIIRYLQNGLAFRSCKLKDLRHNWDQVIAVTGLSPCWRSLRQAPPPPPRETSQSRTVHPAALRASGRQRRTPTTGPEWPVRVAKGRSADPVNNV